MYSAASTRGQRRGHGPGHIDIVDVEDVAVSDHDAIADLPALRTGHAIPGHECAIRGRNHADLGVGQRDDTRPGIEDSTQRLVRLVFPRCIRGSRWPVAAQCGTQLGILNERRAEPVTRKVPLQRVHRAIVLRAEAGLPSRVEDPGRAVGQTHLLQYIRSVHALHRRSGRFAL